MTRDEIIAHLSLHGWKPVQTSNGFGAINDNDEGYGSYDFGGGTTAGTVVFLPRNSPRKEWPTWEFVSDHVLGTIERNGYQPIDPRSRGERDDLTYAATKMLITQEEMRRQLGRAPQFFSIPEDPMTGTGFWDVAGSAGDPPQIAVAQIKEIEERSKQLARALLLGNAPSKIKFP